MGPGRGPMSQSSIMRPDRPPQNGKSHEPGRGMPGAIGKDRVLRVLCESWSHNTMDLASIREAGEDVEGWPIWLPLGADGWMIGC